MIIIGIDPGYERCGFAVLKKDRKNKVEVLTFGCMRTKSSDNFIKRQSEIAEDFKFLLKKYKPNILSIEDLFFAKNVTTGLKVAQIRGILIYLADISGCEVIEPKPVEAKSFFCGDGKADKKAMQRMAQITFNLKQTPKLDDTADSLAMAYFAAHHLKFKA